MRKNYIKEKLNYIKRDNIEKYYIEKFTQGETIQKKSYLKKII